MRSRKIQLLGALSLIALPVLATSSARAVSNCGGDNTDCPDPDGKGSWFAVETAGAPVVMDQGAEATLGVSIERSKMNAPITVTVSGLPAGVTASHPPPTSGSAVNLQLKASPTASIGTFTVHVRATGTIQNKTVTRSATHTVTVKHALRVGVGTSPAGGTDAVPVILSPCSRLAYRLNVDVAQGVTGAVHLSASGLPAGVTATFNPATVQAPPGGGYVGSTVTFQTPAQLQEGATKTFTLQAAAGAKVGTEAVTLKNMAAVIDSISPKVARTPQMQKPGTTVTLHGQGFCPESSVTFGEANATAKPVFIDPTGTSMKVEIPRLALTGEVKVKNASGVSLGAQLTIDSWRNTHGFSFGNTQSFQDIVGGYTLSDLKEVFGADQVDITILGVDTHIPDPVAAIYLGIVNLALKSGQCFGFALAANDMAASYAAVTGFPAWDGKDPGKTVSGTAPDAWHLAGPTFDSGKNVSPNLAHFIHMRHLKQATVEMGAYIAGYEVTMADDLRKNAKAMLGSGGVILSLLSGSHSVALVDVRDRPGGGFFLDVYDPNVPFTAGEQTDSATHEGRLANGTVTVEKSGHWTYDDKANIKAEGGLASLVVTPASLFSKKLSIPTLGGFGNLFFGSAGGAKVTQITDASGRTLLGEGGVKNVDPATRLRGGVMPFGGGLGGASDPVFVLEGRGPYTVRFAGATPYAFHFAGPGYAAEVEATSGGADRVVVDPQGAALEIQTDAARRDFKSRLVVNAPDKSGRTALVNGSAFRGAPARVAFDASRDNIVYTHAGPAARVTLELSSTKSAASRVVTAPVDVEAGDVVTYKPDWAALERAGGSIVLRKRAGRVVVQRIR